MLQACPEVHGDGAELHLHRGEVLLTEPGLGADHGHRGLGEFLQVGRDVEGLLGAAVHAADAAGGEHPDPGHGGHYHGGGHRGRPQPLVGQPANNRGGQRQEDGATIPATDPADAAEGWAEWHDRSSAEYRIASGREEIVIVRDAETGEQREWIVRGEAMPYYTAQPGESATIRAQVAPGRWEDVPRRSEANK